MKSYISLNNEKRTECSINKDKIAVELFKRMSNANVGKQIENVRKYKILELLIMLMKLRKQQLK